MAARSSGAKNWGWAVAQRSCLNDSIISMQRSTPDTKLASRGTALSLRLCFVEASLTVEKAVLCCKADRLVASLPSFCNIQPSLAVHEFHAAGEERCKRGHGRSVCKPLMPDVMAPKAHQNNHNYVSSADLHSDSLHKNLVWWEVAQRTSKSPNWGGGGMGACKCVTTQSPTPQTR